MDLGGLTGIALGLLGYVAIGVALRKGRVLKPEDAKVLNTAVMWVALPALIFMAMHNSELSVSLGIMPLVGWAMVGVGLALAFVLARVFKLRGPLAGAFILAAVFGNTAYMGYPVAQALHGDAGLVRAIFSDLFGNTAATLTVGTLIAARYGAREAKTNPVRDILTFPPFIALVAALLFHSVPLPDAVSTWLTALSKLVVPLIMIGVGLSLKPKALGGHLGHATAVAAVKLVMMPLAALVLASALTRDPIHVSIAVLEAGVPTMMMLMIIGERFKLDTDFIGSAILVTMVGAIVTIPLMQLLAA